MFDALTDIEIIARHHITERARHAPPIRTRSAWRRRGASTP